MGFYIEIVEGMAELMREGDNIAECTVEIGEYAALVVAGKTCAECAADLAFTGIEINPCFIKGTLDHVCKLLIEAAEGIEKVALSVFGRVLFGASLGEGCEHVIPGHAVLMSESFGFDTQILAEYGHVFVHGFKKRIEGLPLHPCPVQRFIQGGFKAAKP